MCNGKWCSMQDYNWWDCNTPEYSNIHDARGNTQKCYSPRNTGLKLDVSVHIGIFLVKVKYRREYQLCNRSPMSLSQVAYRDYIGGDLGEWWVLTEANGRSLLSSHPTRLHMRIHCCHYDSAIVCRMKWSIQLSMWLRCTFAHYNPQCENAIAAEQIARRNTEHKAGDASSTGTTTCGEITRVHRDIV